MAEPSEPSSLEPGDTVSVLTVQPPDRFLDYRVPEGGCRIGDFVEVPLGPRKVLGVVWGVGRSGFDPSRIRPIRRVLDAVPMRDEMRVFLTRAGDYTLTPMHSMLRLATRAPGLGDPPSMQKVYRLGCRVPDRMTDARSRVLAVLREYEGLGFALRELAGMAGTGVSVVKGLVAREAVREEDTPRDRPFPTLEPDFRPAKLNEDQARAAAQLIEGVTSGVYGATLLKGVTGSGKTEVYLNAVAETLRRGRQALVLLPEIALTVEFMNRVEARFGARPAEWHSGVTMTERRRLWRMAGQGGVQLVAGARSALFLPFRNLGLIVVDEEHDDSYKQEDGALYNARDMAVLRAACASAQVVLSSATPSLETWENARIGKYRRLDLTARFGTAELPEMRTIDMRREDMPAGTWLSPTLKAAIALRVSSGEQTLLFLNRRGYAPVTLCRACGHQIGCGKCDARMVEHRHADRLVCHLCGETSPVPRTCPHCEAEGRLVAVGPGVERLAEEVSTCFPDARVRVLSSDLLGSARALRHAMAEIAGGRADIVIGTQLVAKGHNFPLITLVGVVDADLGLQGSDPRAAERTFQLIRQVAGRAGRAERRGLAMLQTWQPEHPVIRAILSGGEEEFWRTEAHERKAAGMPPYGRLVGIVLSGPEVAPVMSLANDMARCADPLRAVGAQLYGPAPAPITRIRGRHRVRMLIRAARAAPVQKAVAEWTGRFRLPRDVRMTVDIDPRSFY